MAKSWVTTSFNYPIEKVDMVIKAQNKAKIESKSFSQIVLELVDKHYINNNNNNNNELSKTVDNLIEFIKNIDNFLDSKQYNSKDLAKLEGQLMRITERTKQASKDTIRKERFGR